MMNEQRDYSRHKYLTIQHPKFHIFSTYRDHVIVFGTLLVLCLVYRIRGNYAWLSSTALGLSILTLVPRFLWPQIDWLGRLDAWKPGVATVAWLIYGSIYYSPATLFFPNWIGWSVSMLTCAVAVASYFKMDVSMSLHYQYVFLGQIMIAVLFPSQDTCPLLSSPSHMITRFFLFYFIWMFNDIRIRCCRYQQYSSVDVILLPLQSIWVLFAWYPAVVAIGGLQMMWLLFIAVKEATTYTSKKWDLPVTGGRINTQEFVEDEDLENPPNGGFTSPLRNESETELVHLGDEPPDD